MRKKVFRTLGVMVLSAAMVLGAAMPALAVTAPEPISVTITKKIKKDANDYAPAETYTFTVEPGDAESAQGNKLEIKQGIMNAIDGSGVYTIKSEPRGTDIGHNEIVAGTAYIKVDASKLEEPGIYRYEISETVEDSLRDNQEDYDSTIYYMDVYKYQNGTCEIVTYKSDVTDLEVKANKSAPIFTNDITDEGENTGYHDLSVTKKVDGSMGDKKKEFAFTLSYKIGEGRKVRLVTPDNTEGMALEGTDSVQINLAHDKSFHVYGLSDDDEIGVIETDYTGEGYKPTYTGMDLVMSASADKKIDENVTGTVTNTKDVTTPTGVVRDFAPYILMIALAGCMVIVFFRKRHED
jgi:hypothetical protein